MHWVLGLSCPLWKCLAGRSRPWDSDLANIAQCLGVSFLLHIQNKPVCLCEELAEGNRTQSVKSRVTADPCER